MTIKATIQSIDQQTGWETAIGSDINPVAPTGYAFVQLSDGIRLYECGAAYAGWLAKHVDPLLYSFPKISLSYWLMIDDATEQQAQIIETDAKITSADGWTYDFSAQWNIQEGWMFQVVKEDGSWVDTGIKVTPPSPNAWWPVQIDYAIDYANHRSSVLGVTAGGTHYDVPENLQKISAKQLGWQPSSILTQLQQCNNALAGAHSEKFGQISYGMEG